MRRIIAALSLTALIACADREPEIQIGATTTPDSLTSSVTAGRESAVALKSVVFLGTSLTAGYGVGPDVAYPALIQQKIDTEKLPFVVTNAGISGETSAGGLRRVDWVLQNPVDVLVLELGANDGLRALNVDSMKHNLDVILQKTRAKYPDAAIVIAGMEAPPNLGTSYTKKFHDAFVDLAKKYDASLVPFLLAGVAGDRKLNQEDGLHPSPEGHKVLADNVWAVLKPVLVQRAAVLAK